MRISTTLPMTQTGVPDVAMAKRLEDLGYDSIGMAAPTRWGSASTAGTGFGRRRRSRRPEHN